MEGNEPVVIPNSEGGRTTPSVVAFLDDGKGERKVGSPAKRQAITNPGNTVSSVKRFMGKNYSNVSDEMKNVSYNVEQGNNDTVRVRIGDRLYTPQEISAMILQKMKSTAEDYLGTTVDEAVITVPAYFNDAERQATKEAGQIAGLEVKRIINEPTAAALAYGMDKKSSDVKIAVYDLGGGTFDISILELGDGVFEVLSTNGDVHLGGDDFDAKIIDWLAEEFLKDENIDLRKDPMALQRLKEAAEKAKIELSTRETAMVGLPFVGASRPIHLQYTIRRDEFNELISPLLQRTIDLTTQCVRDAGFGLDGIDGLVLSGGSSRIPLVRTYLQRALGLEAAGRVNPDEIVAVGAAVQAGILRDNWDDIHLNDVTSYSLGVEIDNDRYVPVMERNTQIPATAKRIFTTISDNQSSVEVRVLQGDSDRASTNRSLGRFLLSGIREGKRGEPRIEVSFTVDADGIAHVSARDIDTNAVQRITVSPEPEGGDSQEILASRLSSLINRVSALAAHSQGHIDYDFSAEVDELLGYAHQAVSSQDLKRLRESQIALEAVLHELNDAAEVGAARNEGA
jgi:molecular chaperone DnaK